MVYAALDGTFGMLLSIIRATESVRRGTQLYRKHLKDNNQRCSLVRDCALLG